MHIVTGISLSNSLRLERQRYCIDTWKNHASTITLVQHETEKEQIKECFPGFNYEFHGGPVRTEIVEYTNLALVYDEPIMFINSDIEINQSPEAFTKHWSNIPIHQLQIGIRHNYATDPAHSLPENWGVDAFCVTPTMAATIPNYGFQIGLPVWDYWIVYHFWLNKYTISCDLGPSLLHKTHPLNWKPEDHKHGFEIMKKATGKSKEWFNSWMSGLRRQLKTKKGRVVRV